MINVIVYVNVEICLLKNMVLEDNFVRLNIYILDCINILDQALKN